MQVNSYKWTIMNCLYKTQGERERVRDATGNIGYSQIIGWISKKIWGYSADWSFY